MDRAVVRVQTAGREQRQDPVRKGEGAGASVGRHASVQTSWFGNSCDPAATLHVLNKFTVILKQNLRVHPMSPDELELT